jgi:hypothetical protein
MRRAGRERPGGSASVFVRPVVMLVIGVAAGLVMWRVLMADAGLGHGVRDSRIADSESEAPGGQLEDANRGAR